MTRLKNIVYLLGYCQALPYLKLLLLLSVAHVVENSTELRCIHRVLERQWHVATVPKIAYQFFKN